MISDQKRGSGIGIAPLFGGLAEKGAVEQVRLAGIDGGGRNWEKAEILKAES